MTAHEAELPSAGPQASAGVSADIRVDRTGFRLEAVFEAAPGSCTAVMGPNGAGKSTLLHALAGFAGPELTGSIELVDSSGRRRRLLGDGIRPPKLRERRVTLLEQSANLFPHLSVLDNAAFGLISAGVPKQRAHEQARQWLERVELSGCEQAKPSELSGGQQQRAAIARALAARTSLLLLDEPFAALDADAVPRLRGILARALADSGTTALIVTHDLDDALQLADACLVLEDGDIVERTSPLQIATAPRSRFGAALAGIGCIEIDGELAFASPADVSLVDGDAAGPTIVEDTAVSISARSGRILITGARGLIAEVDPGRSVPRPGDPIRMKAECLRTL